MNENEELSPKAKKPIFKVLLIVLACAVGLTAAVAGVGFATNWFGLYGPGTQILQAAANTATAGSFTVRFSSVTDYDAGWLSTDTRTEGTASVVFDPTGRNLTVYAEFTTDGTSCEMGIVDGWYFLRAGRYYSAAHEIDEELDSLFDSMESGEITNWEDIVEELDEVCGIRLSDYLNFDAIQSCLVSYGKSWNNDTWLQENAGYSCSKEDGVTVHQFQPEYYALLKATLEAFRPAFREEADYETVSGVLRDARGTLNGTQATAKFGIENRRLTSLALTVQADGYLGSTSMSLSEIGSTSIDEEALRLKLMQAVNSSTFPSTIFP